MEPPAPGGQGAGAAGQYKVVLLGSAKDREGNPIGDGLYNCLYGPLKSKRMAKKEAHVNPPVCYEFVCGLEHPTVLAIDDFFVHKSEGFIVVEPVDETFEAWVSRTKKDELFIQTANGEVRLSQKLRNMIIELASLVDLLFKKGYCPTRLSMNDIFMKHMEFQGPILKVLLAHNLTPYTGCSTGIGSSWTTLSAAIDHCCKAKRVVLDFTSEEFRNCIGQHRSVHFLKAYPDAWTDREKSEYMLLIGRGNRSEMDDAIKRAKVEWPLDPNDPSGRTVMQDIEDIRYHHSSNNVAFYNLKKPEDYNRLCRNVIKHFFVPKNVETEVKDRSGFIRKMEQFDPEIWLKLYYQIGPLGDE